MYQYLLGNCLNELDQLEDAIICYDKSIALNPNKYEFFFNKS